MPKISEPDDFGRLRVRDKDTGHERSIPAWELSNGNYVVLSEPASEPHTGVILPPKFSVEAVEPTTTKSGQTAENKEQADG